MRSRGDATAFDQWVGWWVVNFHRLRVLHIKTTNQEPRHKPSRKPGSQDPNPKNQSVVFSGATGSLALVCTCFLASAKSVVGAPAFLYPSSFSDLGTSLERGGGTFRCKASFAHLHPHLWLSCCCCMHLHLLFCAVLCVFPSFCKKSSQVRLVVRH